MSSADSTSGNIINLFSGNSAFYTVPRYQRNYVWQDSNWEQLYDDIMQSTENESWTHFLGTFVFQQNSLSADNVEYIIIDGQQRIITLQLLLMAMIVALARKNIETPNEDIDNYIDKIKDLIKRKPPKGFSIQRIVIDYDPLYSVICAAVLAGDPHDPLFDNKASSLIANCFRFYLTKFSESSISNIIAFYNKLIATKYVAFNSYNEEYAYYLFETLNARGTQLKQMELLKNYLFHYLQPSDQIDVYKNKWINMENILLNNTDDCDNFLFSFYKCKFAKTSPKTTEEKLYASIKSSLNKDRALVFEFYNGILSCAPIYADILNCSYSNTEIVFLLRYFNNVASNKMFRCVLMALFYQYSKNTISEGVLLKLLTLLRNYLLIFNFRHITANRIEKNVYTLAYNIFNSTCSRDVSYYTYSFIIKDLDFLNLSDLNENISEIRYSNRRRFSSATSKRLIYLFEMIYKELFTDYNYIGTYENWTIEHIINDSELNPSVTYIGNLLVANLDLQKACKNKTYEEKRKEYLKSGYAWIKEYADKNTTDPTPESIKQRTNDLANQLIKLLAFDIDSLTDYCQDVNQAINFIKWLATNTTENEEILNDINDLTYSSIKPRIEGKHKRKDLIEEFEKSLSN